MIHMSPLPRTGWPCLANCHRVDKQKGHLQSFTGDHFLVTFNAAKYCNQQHVRAWGLVAKLQMMRSLGKVHAGIISRPCLAGSYEVHKHSYPLVAGPGAHHAGHLEELCSWYGVECLVTSLEAKELESYCTLQWVDVVEIPSLHPKPVGLVGVMGANDDGEQDEWMYEQEQQRRDNIYGPVNEAFKALLANKGKGGNVKALVSECDRSLEGTKTLKVSLPLVPPLILSLSAHCPALPCHPPCICLHPDAYSLPHPGVSFRTPPLFVN